MDSPNGSGRDYVEFDELQERVRRDPNQAEAEREAKRLNPTPIRSFVRRLFSRSK